MITPFSPQDALNSSISNIPEEIIQAINQLLAQKYDGSGSVTISLAELKLKAVELMLANGMKEPIPGQWGEKGWLNFETAYRQAGWKVTFNRPSYDESFEAHWVFSDRLKDLPRI